jgi:hypothetical protein
MGKGMPFEWEVPIGGFRWVGDQPRAREDEWIGPFDPGRWGPPYLVPSDEWRKRRYQPLEVPALFRIFAYTPPTVEGILAFANEYGRLHHPTREGESFGDWVEPISLLRFIIELWDALQAQDEEMLRQIITIRRDEDLGLWAVDYKIPPSTGWKPDLTTYPDESTGFTGEGDIWHAALSLVRFAVDSHLEGKTTPRLLYSSSTDSLAFVLLPETLLHGLWLQFALSIDGNTKFRRCRSCQTWFVISPDANRVTREYCSDACRARAYRNRKAGKTEA